MRLSGAVLAMLATATVAQAQTQVQAPASAQAPAPAAAPIPAGPQVLVMRGLDKITGRPTNIEAPIGKTVKFATLTITARFCYSTPPSETPETTAFVQIDDHRPDQSERRVFSGWMYASSPGLNAVEHPLYDVWVIACRGSGAPPTAAMVSNAPVTVAAPDSSDKDTAAPAMPEGAGQ